MKEKEIPNFSKYPALNDYMHKKDKYILDENNNVIPADLIEWGRFLEDNKGDSIVKQEHIGDLWISTVFIGLDYRLALQEEKLKPNYKPDIFETTIFKDDRDIYCNRYSTWREAEEGHKKAVEWVKNGCKDE
jgi:hypothetical protein